MASGRAWRARWWWLRARVKPGPGSPKANARPLQPPSERVTQRELDRPRSGLIDWLRRGHAPEARRGDRTVRHVEVLDIEQIRDGHLEAHARAPPHLEVLSEVHREHARARSDQRADTPIADS